MIKGFFNGAWRSVSLPRYVLGYCVLIWFAAHNTSASIRIDRTHTVPSLGQTPLDPDSALSQTQSAAFLTWLALWKGLT